MFRHWIRETVNTSKAAVYACRAAAASESAYLAGELAGLKGMVPLLARWRGAAGLSPYERALLTAQLRRASSLSPYLIAALVPGSVVALPLVALWRRRRSIAAVGTKD